jgi:hypothetical protein
MFVDRIIQHLENAMVQPAFVRVADVHPGAFPDRFQTLELIYFGRIVPISTFGHKIQKRINKRLVGRTSSAPGTRPKTQPELYGF